MLLRSQGRLQNKNNTHGILCKYFLNPIKLGNGKEVVGMWKIYNNQFVWIIICIFKTIAIRMTRLG